MAEPLLIQFGADTSRAQAAISSLAASVIGNMAQISVSMRTGAANTNDFGGAMGGIAQNLSRAYAAVNQDVRNISKATLGAATQDKATLEGIVSAFTGAAVASNTAGAAVRTGVAATSAGLRGLFAQIPSLSTLISTFALLGAGKIGFDLISAAAHAASDALEGVAKIGADASRLGVSTTFLQTYTAQARNLRVEAEDLTKALETAKAAFTVTQGEGGKDARNQSSFEARLRQQQSAGNVTAGQVTSFLAAQGTEGQFRAALDIMIQLEAKGRELAALDLASRIFPPAIVDRIREGSLALDRLRATMDDVHNPELVLLKPEEIARAQELQRRLEDAQRTLDQAGREFNKTLADAGASLKEDAIAWKEVMAAGARILINALQGAQTAAKAYLEGGAGLSSGGRGTQPGQRTGADLAASALNPVTPVSQDEQQRRDAMDRLRGNLGNRTLVEQAQRASQAMSAGIRRDPTAPIRTDHPKGGGGASEAADPVETFIGQLQKSAAALKAETDNFAKSNAEKAVAIQLAKAQEIASQNGTTLTDAQTAAIRRAGEETARYRDRLADLEQQQRQGAETARYFGDALASGLGDAIFSGTKLTDVLRNLQGQLGRSTLQALFTGQGPLAGLLGTAPAASAGSNAVGGLAGLFTGSGGLASLFRANGGPVEAGRPYTVGEMGRELFIPNQNGRMVPIERGGIGAATSNVTHAPSYQIVQSPGMSPEAVAAAIDRNNRSFVRQLPALTQMAQRRYG